MGHSTETRYVETACMNPSHLVWLFSYSGRLHCTEYRVAIYVSFCSVAFNRPGRIWSNLCTVSIKRSRMGVIYICQVSGSRGILVILRICLACNTVYLFKIHVEELGCHFFVYLLTGCLLLQCAKGDLP